MLEVIAGCLMATTAGILGWILTKIFEHEKRILTVEIECKRGD